MPATLSVPSADAPAKSPSRSEPTVEAAKETDTKAKSVTPPPPPSIREDYVKAKKDSKEGGGKGGSGRKRQRDSDGGKKRDPSSSPSPPPVKSNKKESKKTLPKIPKIPKIPKKKMHDEDESESAGFCIEGPGAEFAAENGGRLPNNKKGNKRQRTNNKDQSSTDKKSRLTVDLFGDDEPASVPNSINPPQPSPSTSKTWAKFKEENPDEYRDNISEASSDIRCDVLF